MRSAFLKAAFKSAALCLLVLAASFPLFSADDPVYAPLWLYQGSWVVTPKNLAPGAPPDQLTNDCSLTGKYFACQQTVNGKIAALVVFIPADTPGHYFTNALLPQGNAGGRGELEISGDNWTYSGKSEEGGKTSYHRTRNTFTGKDRIHFEVGESVDGVNWTVTLSGDEVRVAGNSKSKH
jgi:hypothetical protein